MRKVDVEEFPYLLFKDIDFINSIYIHRWLLHTLHNKQSVHNYVYRNHACCDNKARLNPTGIVRL